MKAKKTLYVYMNVGRFGDGRIEVVATDFDQETCANLEYVKIAEREIELEVDVPNIDFEQARKQLDEQKKIAQMAKLQDQLDRLKGQAA